MRTFAALAAVLVTLSLAGVPAGASAAPRTFTNPLSLRLPDGNQAVNCADPDVVRDGSTWYLYCTTDVIEAGHEAALVPTYTSHDMTNWTYAGPALSARPAWIGSGDLWAPDIVHRGGTWFLYYAASKTAGGGPAIGVLTASSPRGPWRDSGGPVVPPQQNPYSPADERAVIDPEVVRVGGALYLYYGSYPGGISVRRLTADGRGSVASTDRRIAIDNRYEGASVVRHGGWYYLLASATNCCNGPLTGYAVFAARSRSPFGPFLDRHGRSMLAHRVGGTPVLAQNGNRWVGPGHNTVVTDRAGQQWIYYHAIDRRDPYVPGNVGYTKRTLLLDALDWHSGWPVANGGRGPSTRTQPAPAAQQGQRDRYRARYVRDERPGRALSGDEFTHGLSRQWTWVRRPDASTYRVRNGALSIDTQAGDLQPPATPLASVLTRPAPRGDYVVETRLAVNVPNDGSVHNYVQGALVVYADDGNYVKAAVTAIFDTRQTEFGKHVAPVPAGYPSYGNTVVGPVAAKTYLRIVRHANRYTAYSSPDGRRWDRGGTWTLDTAGNPRLGLVSLGGAGFTSTFDYVRVNRVRS